MRIFALLFAFLLLAGCGHNRSQPGIAAVPPVVSEPAPLAYIVNPGAVLEIVIMNQTQMDRLVEIPGFKVGGYAPPDRLEVWVVVTDIEHGTFTPREAGVLAHELAHKADELHVSYWRILRLASTDDFMLDTHEYGLLPQ